MRNNIIGLIVLAIIIIIVVVWPRGDVPQDVETTTQAIVATNTPDISIVAENLDIPWELVFLPSGDMLVTERPGDLLRISSDGQVRIPISGVAHRGEGGLLGLALHPDFENNGLIYLYLTTSESGAIINRVDRYRLEGDQLFDRTTIIDGIPGASNHDGGRIAFGPDGHLYITTGDAGNESSAQDINALSGKILRVTAEGGIPADNPFNNAVYSYGHRNPQGLAWDSAGRLFATEHGRSGVRSGFDEINLIIKGGNYGWPDVEGDAAAPNMIKPLAHSGAHDTWAPSGMVFYDGRLFFAGLRGEAVYEAVLQGGSITEDVLARLSGAFGRLRSITFGPDGFFYILTNNGDGRGNARQGDDKIIRIDPEAL